MKPWSKLFEQKFFNTRPQIVEYMLIVMNKSTHEVNSSQILQTNKKQNEIAVTFLSDCIGIFNVTNKTIFFWKRQLTMTISM